MPSREFIQRRIFRILRLGSDVWAFASFSSPIVPVPFAIVLLEQKFQNFETCSDEISEFWDLLWRFSYRTSSICNCALGVSARWTFSKVNALLFTRKRCMFVFCVRVQKSVPWRVDTSPSLFTTLVLSPSTHRLCSTFISKKKKIANTGIHQLNALSVVKSTLYYTNTLP